MPNYNTQGSQKKNMNNGIQRSSVGTKNNQMGDLLMKNSQTIALSGLLKEDISTGTKMINFGRKVVNNILKFIWDQWDHKNGILTYNIPTTGSNVKEPSLK